MENFPFFKPQYCLEIPSWDTILSNLNYSVVTNLKPKLKHLCPSHFVTHHANRIPEVSKVLRALNLCDAHLYISLTQNEIGFGKHYDIVDVFYWQVQGSTRWNVENFGSYTLKKGDLIFVPKLINHEVITLEPRAGILMSVAQSLLKDHIG